MVEDLREMLAWATFMQWTALAIMLGLVLTLWWAGRGD